MVTQELGRYQSRERPYTGMSADDPETLSPYKSSNTDRSLGSDGNMALASTSSPLSLMQQFDNRNSNPLVPVRRPTVGLSGAQVMPGHQQNASVNAVETLWNVDTSDVASSSSRSDRATEGLDIHSLAQEVAAVLHSTSAIASSPNMKEGQSRLIITNDDSSQVRLASTSGDGDHERDTFPRDNMTTESPPPHYTVAGGGQRNW